MDKNLAALLRSDCKTVHVRYLLDEYEPQAIPARPRTVSSNTQRLKAADEPSFDVMPVAMSPKLYTYVSSLPVSVGDTVVVIANKMLKLARVQEVDDGMEIEPGASMAYGWVVDVVDLAHYEREAERNREITRLASDAQRTAMRATFAQTLVNQIGGTKGEKLRALLGGPDESLV